MATRIGIMSGGGDCAGINAAIAAAVMTGDPLGYEFVGFMRGWEGLLDGRFRELGIEDVHGISHLGGTILRTTNKGRFGAKSGTGAVRAIPAEVLRQARDRLAEMDIDGLIVVGGDGTLSGALQLEELGVRIVGIPKSIDNDLSGTDRTLGFGTAVQVAVDAIDRIHTTATSHDRMFFVESMGRSAGWLALHAGLASGAAAILLPEFPFALERLLAFLRHRRDTQHTASIVVVAEAVTLEGHAVARTTDLTSEVLYGGISTQLMARLETLAPDEFDLRNVVLGHTQRGGPPNADDRILSKRFGVAAMEAYANGAFGCMVGLRGNAIELVPIAEAVGSIKRVTTESMAYRAARTLGVFFQ